MSEEERRQLDRQNAMRRMLGSTKLAPWAKKNSHWRNGSTEKAPAEEDAAPAAAPAKEEKPQKWAERLFNLRRSHLSQENGEH